MKDCTISATPVCVNTLPGHTGQTGFVSTASLSLAILLPFVTATLPSKDKRWAQVKSCTAMRPGSCVDVNEDGESVGNTAWVKQKAVGVLPQY